MIVGREEASSFPPLTQSFGLGEGPPLPSADQSVSVQALSRTDPRGSTQSWNHLPSAAVATSDSPLSI